MNFYYFYFYYFHYCIFNFIFDFDFNFPWISTYPIHPCFNKMNISFVVYGPEESTPQKMISNKILQGLLVQRTHSLIVNRGFCVEYFWLFLVRRPPGRGEGVSNVRVGKGEFRAEGKRRTAIANSRWILHVY